MKTVVCSSCESQLTLRIPSSGSTTRWKRCVYTFRLIWSARLTHCSLGLTAKALPTSYPWATSATTPKRSPTLNNRQFSSALLPTKSLRPPKTTQRIPLKRPTWCSTSLRAMPPGRRNWAHTTTNVWSRVLGLLQSSGSFHSSLATLLLTPNKPLVALIS